MDKEMYIEKFIFFLNGGEVYKECRDKTKPVHYKVVKLLWDLKNSIQHKFKEQYNTLCPLSDSSPSYRILWSPKNT